MGNFNSEPDFADEIRKLRNRIEGLERSLGLRKYAGGTRPDPAKVKGLIIFVTDAAAGSKFQGSDGTAWVALG